MFNKFLRSNYFALILAVFLALILWLFVVGEVPFQVTPDRKNIRDIPVVYINLDNDLEATLERENVAATLEGVPELLGDIDSENMVAFVNLADKGPGLHEDVEVQINPPEDLSLVTYLPSQMQVYIEEE